jgi:DNA-binding NtrC family response regulator
MGFSAIQFMVDERGSRTMQREVEPGFLQKFNRRDFKAPPIAFVVSERSLKAIENCGESIENRGKMDIAGWQLSRYLLGRKKIPLIAGRYSSPGRLRQGVFRLIEQASATPEENNIYFIATDDSIFEKLWQQAKSGHISLRLPKNTCPGSGRRAEDFASAEKRLELLPPRETPADLEDYFAGASPQARLVRRHIMQAADNNDPVLILGATGTGKELIARAVHRYHAGRRNGRFVAVNCGAMPDELLESELFGHVKGAFSGATADKTGLWEDASGGTLFLDEIGELPLEQQAKINRALQFSEIRRLGETRTRRVDSRVIAATNRDMGAMLSSGEFREDLYQRLSGLEIHTPALADNPEEIPGLALSFWKKITLDEDAELPLEILQQLQAYYWPGNIRELKKVLKNLKNEFGTRKLCSDHLQVILQGRVRPLAGDAAPAAADELLRHQADCLRHLTRAGDLIRACEIALELLWQGARIDARSTGTILRSLKTPLADLGQSCLHPLLFAREDAYAAVSRLRDTLAGFAGMSRRNLQNRLPACRAALAKKLSSVLAKLFREAERVSSRR